ncbi:Dehydrogenases with different specificities [Mycoavidus cysteinexigens]|uniref:Dehydrogenases with different specificities n=1 Tax=Mycoavidus cysteinexigens TaxID=1553431 RepID=A0A2Z6EU47_9BURK|nr:hypothetical protein [Mycoavidus cysteinexigens]BBE08950.1 Dehydrogenases with different specificities [Mycoavidus cysteinexigens]GAM52326.1 hypothetical protein EBME_0789 [bacterium endosymbiont of Mortierella elongata FMR23-6]GLR01205.1 hypothetical protein GCM10007934_10170 [Mycoavidus cysteinexigens]
MRPSPISRQQPQTLDTERNDSGSKQARQNNRIKRKAALVALDNINAYNDSLNKASQREVKRRSGQPFNAQKEKIQSEVGPDHGLGVGIVTIDNLETAINSLLYPKAPSPVLDPPIDVGSQPDVFNAPDEEDLSFEISDYLHLDEDDQPESQNAEMDLEREPEANYAALSDNAFQAVGLGVVTGTSDNQEEASSSADYSKRQQDALNHPIDFCSHPEVLSALSEKDFSLDFLDELDFHDENAVPGNQNAEMSSEEELDANHAGLSVNDFQEVEENTSLKKKIGPPMKWTPEMEGKVRDMVQANAELTVKQLHAQLQDWCKNQEPPLTCPSYPSVVKKCAKRSDETRVQWMPEWKDIARELIKANANAVPKLSKLKLYAILKKKCGAPESQSAFPSYESFNKNFLGRNFKHFAWPSELGDMARGVINKYSKHGYKIQYNKLMEEIKENYPSKKQPTLKNFRTFKEKMMKQASVIENETRR